MIFSCVPWLAVLLVGRTHDDDDGDGGGVAQHGGHTPIIDRQRHAAHTAVKRVARAQFQPKLSLNKVLNFRKFSLSSPKLRQSLKS